MLIKSILLLCLASGLLTGCYLAEPVRDILAPPDVPLTDPAKDWMHEQDGQQLSFRNAASQTQSVRVRRLSGDAKTGVLSGKIPIPHVPVKTEFIELDYYFLAQKDSVSLVVSNSNVLKFFNTVLPDFAVATSNQQLATFQTASDPATERVSSPNALELNYTLGTHTYISVLRVPNVATSKITNPKPTDAEEIFYSRADGLVGYKTLDGQLWLRQ